VQGFRVQGLGFRVYLNLTLTRLCKKPCSSKREGQQAEEGLRWLPGLTSELLLNSSLGHIIMSLLIPTHFSPPQVGRCCQICGARSHPHGHKQDSLTMTWLRGATSGLTLINAAVPSCVPPGWPLLSELRGKIIPMALGSGAYLSLLNQTRPGGRGGVFYIEPLIGERVQHTYRNTKGGRIVYQAAHR
jgi:hypothetical protein